MPPGGWGRRAAGKIDRKLEDDELFKEIGGQLDESNFDYSQWQRSKAKVPTTRRPPPPQKKDLINAFDRPMTGIVYYLSMHYLTYFSKNKFVCSVFKTLFFKEMSSNSLYLYLRDSSLWSY